MIYNIDIRYTLYVKAENAGEAESIARYSSSCEEPSVTTQRVRPGDYVAPDSLSYPPYSRRGDYDETSLADLIEAARERAKDDPDAESLEAAGQLTLEQP